MIDPISHQGFELLVQRLNWQPIHAHIVGL